MQLSKTSQLADFFRQFDQIVFPQYELKYLNLYNLIQDQIYLKSDNSYNLQIFQLANFRRQILKIVVG